MNFYKKISPKSIQIPYILISVILDNPHVKKSKTYILKSVESFDTLKQEVEEYSKIYKDQKRLEAISLSLIHDDCLYLEYGYIENDSELNEAIERLKEEYLLLELG